MISERVIKSINEKQLEESVSNESPGDEKSVSSHHKSITKSFPKSIRRQNIRRRKKSAFDIEPVETKNLRNSQRPSKIRKTSSQESDHKSSISKSSKIIKNSKGKRPRQKESKEFEKLNDDANSVTEDINYFVTESKEAQNLPKSGLARESSSTRNIGSKRGSTSSMVHRESNLSVVHKPISKIMVSNLSNIQPKVDTHHDPKRASLKRSNYWQFNNINEKLKILHSKVKYNSDLKKQVEGQAKVRVLELGLPKMTLNSIYVGI